jgi:hypothetical protein
MSASHRHIKSKLRGLHNDPVKPSMKGFTSTVKGFKERQQEAQDATNPSTVGSRAVEPSTTGIQSGASNSPRTQRPAKSTTEKGMKFSGKTVQAVLDWVKDAANAVGAFAAASTAKVAADAFEGSEHEDPEVSKAVANFYAASIAMLQKCLASGKGLVDMVQAEQSTDGEIQPGLSEFHGKSAGAPEDDCEANRTGHVSGSGMDAGVQVIRSYGMDVSLTHVATVDAATRLMAEQAEWKKVALQRAIADGDEAEAHRIRFGLPHYPASGVIGEYFKTVSN